MGRISDTEFTDNPYIFNARFFELFTYPVNFHFIDRLYFPTTVVDGAGYGIILIPGTEIFRIYTRPGRNNHAHRRHSLLDNGVGGQGGGDNNPLNASRINAFKNQSKT